MTDSAHVLCSSLAVEPEVTTHPLLRGDVYLLCSDGLWNAVDEEEMIRSLSTASQPTDLPAAAAHLVQMANQAGVQDNITAVLVRVA